MFETSKLIYDSLEAGKKVAKGNNLSLSTLQKLYEASTCVVPVKDGDKYSFRDSVLSEITIANLAKKNISAFDYYNILNLYNKYSYSSWCSVKQAAFPEFSSLVPIPLCALKFTRGINYNEWDLESSTHGFGYFLAHALRELNKDAYDSLYSLMTPETINEARKLSRPYTPSGLKDLEDETVMHMWNEGFGSSAATRLARILLGQMWLAGEARSTKMILHATDWDKIPEFVPVEKNTFSLLTPDLV